MVFASSIDFNSRKARFTFAFVLAGLIWFQLYPIVQTYFVADDFMWLRFVRQHTWRSAMSSPSPGGWTTPLPNLLFWLGFEQFGLHPRGYYITIAMLHLFNAWLVFKVVLTVEQRPTLAMASTAVFALHFVHYSDWGAAIWIAAFVHLLAACFFIASFYCYLLFQQTRVRFWWGLGLGLFAAALLSKESALSLPLLLIAWHVVRQSRPKWAQIAVDLAPFLLVWVLYIIYETIFQTEGVYLRENIYGIGLHNIGAWRYFTNLLVPNPTSPPVASFLQPHLPASVWRSYIWANWLLLIGLIVLAIWIVLRTNRQARFWLVAMLLTYLPFTGFVAGFAGANRYFYLPMIGFAVLAVLGFEQFKLRLAERFTPKVAARLAILLVIALWLLNVVPGRAWQQLMQRNALHVAETIQLVEQHLPIDAALDGPIAVVNFGDAAIHQSYAIVPLYLWDTVQLTLPEWEANRRYPAIVYGAERLSLWIAEGEQRQLP